MPFDFAPAGRLPLDDTEICGVPRHALVAHALAQLAPSLRAAVAEIEFEEAGCFVNLGMNVERVGWRAIWRRPGLPEAKGCIPVWKGEIAG